MPESPWLVARYVFGEPTCTDYGPESALSTQNMNQDGNCCRQRQLKRAGEEARNDILAGDP